MEGHSRLIGQPTTTPEMLHRDVSPQEPSSQNMTAVVEQREIQVLPKLKGRQRLMASLQRISSNSSLKTPGRPRARTYNGSGRGSISCISLNSTAFQAPGLSLTPTRELVNGFVTAPTSAVNTPGAFPLEMDDRTRERPLLTTDGQTTATLPGNLRPVTSDASHIDRDYFTRPVIQLRPKRKEHRTWLLLPDELKIKILAHLGPKEVIRISRVCRAWHKTCFDGQLWSRLDTTSFYNEVPADALVKIITYAGPFVRDLNLRGCVQLSSKWHTTPLPDACRNLESFSLQGCHIDRGPMHNFLHRNGRLVHLNLSGLSGVHTSTMKVIAANCPKLEHLNVSWCNNLETRGLKHVIQACPNLRDLRASELAGWDDIDLAHEIFKSNSLERLVLIHCDSLTDNALSALLEGRDQPIDPLTRRPIVPARRLRHLDLTRCRGISDVGLRSLVGNVPHMEGLSLSKCTGLSDGTLNELIPTMSSLTHLDLEELVGLTNSTLVTLSTAPCAKRLRHLGISYCESVSDFGVLPVLRNCINLRSLEMDNTRISDLSLVEAALSMRNRPRVYRQDKTQFKPVVGLRLIAYDCQNVTWTGVREILYRNAEVFVNTHTTDLPPLEKSAVTISASAASSTETVQTPSRIAIVRTCSYPSEIIQLKCFYTYQPTVEEHTKRVLRGDFAAARRLERKWAEFMIAQEEAGAGGAGHRRRRRRAREAQMMHADEEDASGSGSGVGGGRRRRARSGGCAVM